MKTYEEIKEEIIETNYLISLTLDQDKTILTNRLKSRLARLIDEAIAAKKLEKIDL